MQNLGKLTRRRLGELLEAEGLITQKHVQEAIQIQQKGPPGKLLGEIFVELGYIKERDIARCIASQYNLPYLDVSRYNVSKNLFGLFTLEELHQNSLVPLDKMDTLFVMATYGQISEEQIEIIEKRLQCEVYLFVTTPSEAEALTNKVLSRFKPTIKPS